MLCALIMAGGKGTRFWPLSTEEKPKQFLNLLEDKTMIQRTINRIKPIIPIERIFICTGKKYVDLVKSQIPELDSRNIIVEPEARNTLPCIALSTFVINRYFNECNIVVLPSDHLIEDEDKFRRTITLANSFVLNNKKALITFGIKPTRAETGYGYIKLDRDTNFKFSSDILKVDCFVEKPDMGRAEKYIQDGGYLWNAGMFLWNSETILNEIESFSIDTYSALKEIENCNEEILQSVIDNNYSKTQATSIDYQVLEKSKNIYVIPSDIGWDDVGSWEAVQRYRRADNNGNVNVGKVNCLDGKNNLIVASSGSIVIDGLSDIYVIENDGNIFLGKKDNVSRIKDLKNFVKG